MYTNIRILSIAKGIPIEYNTNETNIENIFALYETNEIIQQFTFQVNITPDKQCLDDAISNSKEVHINDDCILFYSFRYQISFGHFIIQTVPLLRQFLDNPLTKLLVPRHEYSIIQKNIL